LRWLQLVFFNGKNISYIEDRTNYKNQSTTSKDRIKYKGYIP